MKVSVATTIGRSTGGQFALHAKALPGNPHDGHALATQILEIERLGGPTIRRLVADEGYRGHNAPPEYKFRIFISGQNAASRPRSNAISDAEPPSNCHRPSCLRVERF